MGILDKIKGVAEGAKKKYDEYQAKAPQREAVALIKRKKELERLQFETKRAELTNKKLRAEAQVREMRQARFKNLTVGFGSMSQPSGATGKIGAPIFGYKNFKKRRS